MTIERAIYKIRNMSLSNFLFYVFGKFLIGLGIGILLPLYYIQSGWVVAGWMFILFAVVLMVPAGFAVFYKKPRSRSQ